MLGAGMRIFFMLSILAICACDTGGGSSPRMVTNSIDAEWITVDPATQCVELYSFSETGEFSVSALDKLFSGTYTFVKRVPVGNRHELVMYILEDNEQAD